MPGYTCYRSIGRNLHRGGCALLLKNYLIDKIASIETPVEECIILRLKHFPRLTIMTCYIAPPDSQYHSFLPIAELQEKLMRTPEEQLLVLGDLNARFGNSRNTFLQGKRVPDGTYYKASPDPISNPNHNARLIASALEPMILINNLHTPEKEFETSLTFRQGTRWVSELDACLVTVSCLPIITQFEVHQRVDLPSDHAPISVKIATGDPGKARQCLKVRAEALGEYCEDGAIQGNRNYRKPIRMASIDRAKARETLRNCQPPVLDDSDLDATVEAVNHTLYACAQTSLATVPNTPQEMTTARLRWISLLESDDPKTLWKAINWNGSIDTERQDAPSDEAFKRHFELLLNPQESATAALTIPDTQMYLPVSDDPIQPQEVESALKSLKANKSGGPSGIPPGLLKLLPVNWIVYITALLSQLFSSHSYTAAWRYTRLITLFKKGSKMLCDNYRGISIMDSLAKVYDVVLNKRLSLWFKPDREQAGAQEKRGCIEHLLTLRLLFDYAHSKRKKLYVIFVDFSKAYDRVPRGLMLDKMRELGCGAMMIQAIASTYQCTQMILHSATITSSIGVRQGSPTSCFLFTLLVNGLIRRLKEKCQPDGFLGWLHCLMLMDDTVLLATNRENAMEKVKVLTEFCSASGMIINSSKTKFMVINGGDHDRTPLVQDDLTIQNCLQYTYLGSIFTQDGKLTSSLRAQCESKLPHVMKFEAFVRKNTDLPFPGKKKVFEAALLSAIMYGCESWLSNNASKVARPMYLACVRSLLGVRRTTASDLCLAEVGLPPFERRLKEAQKSCLMKLQDQRRGLIDDPFMYALSLARDARTPCAQYIAALEEYNPESDTEALYERIRRSTGTKFISYRTFMNPQLTHHEMYNDCTIKEHERLAFTRVRLSSHNMAIERGRWSRQPREERKCACGEIQDELHVMAQCPLTAPTRSRYPNVNFEIPSFFDITPVTEMSEMCFQMVKDFV